MSLPPARLAASMSAKEKIYAVSKDVLAVQERLHERIAQDAAFRARGGIIYPYDTIHANLDPLFAFFDAVGFTPFFDAPDTRSLADVGCANGDLAFCLAMAGFDVCAMDYSYGRDQAPTAVSIAARDLGLRLSVVDRSLDSYFTAAELDASVVNGTTIPFNNGKFDFTFCLGLLYHLRNPIAFLESLARVTRYAVIGTHVMSHLPDRTPVGQHPIAYFLDDCELNSDPTNYWILTPGSFSRMLKRTGFEVLHLRTLFNNTAEIAVPDDPLLGQRAFAIVRSRQE